jgi:hypothetical protein
LKLIFRSVNATLTTSLSAAGCAEDASPQGFPATRKAQIRETGRSVLDPLRPLEPLSKQVL